MRSTDAASHRLERHLLWRPCDERGLEHLRFVRERDEVLADGLIVRVQDGEPFRLRYEIRCGADYRATTLGVRLLDGEDGAISLTADGDGRWKNAEGEPLGALDGCLDVDISATPFTNTLAIRRLALKPTESAEIVVLYVKVPELRVEPVRQRYTCIELTPTRERYLYEALFRGFEAELELDRDGLVVDYPELFQRVWSG